MGDSGTKKVSGTGSYTGPDTSNPFYQQLQSGGTYDPTKYINLASSTLSNGLTQGSYDAAQKAAEQAYTLYGTSAQELANQQARTAQENVASEYAGSGALNSGAALSAIAQGTSEPLLQASTNLAQLYGNTYSNTLGNEYSNLQNLASLYGNYGSQLTNMLGDYSQSQYIAPQYYYQQGLGDQLLSAGLTAGVTGLTQGLTSSLFL
jgi:hypothetical protein